jgi:acid phosphatase
LPTRLGELLFVLLRSRCTSSIQIQIQPILTKLCRYKNTNVNTKGLFFNSSYPGPLSDAEYVTAWPIPTNASTCAHGKGVLKSVVNTYKGKVATFNYTSPYPYDAKTGNDVP